ncbi:MAG: DUF433 domain-containing protein [Pirellulales bacterium]
MTTTEIAHVLLDDRGVAWIDDTRVKVIEVVIPHFAHGWSPAEMHRQYPHLSLAQIHAALAYYYDHQEVLDADIERSIELAEELRRQALAHGDSPVHKRLREKGLLP